MKEARLIELISECSAENIDFLLSNGNNKQQNELKPNCLYSSKVSE
jgi:hypothetical protein